MPGPPAAADYAAQIAAEWEAREQRLRNPDGWLALVGLHWLADGENRFGAHPANEVVLRGEGVPPRAGSLWRSGSVVRLVPASELLTVVDETGAPGDPAGERELADDTSGAPTVLALGELRIHTIARGERIGLRVRDHQAPALAAFTGIEHFQLDPSWRVRGRLEPGPPGATARLADITGEQAEIPNPGDFVFERKGATYRLSALDGEEGTMWLIFADATTGHETYAAGRYLYSEPLAPDGSAVADFNLAYNPPCVFSPYATCPLPPARNRLPIRVEAGELDYHP